MLLNNNSCGNYEKIKIDPLKKCFRFKGIVKYNKLLFFGYYSLAVIN